MQVRIVDSGFLRVPMIGEHLALFSGTEQHAIAILLRRGLELAFEFGMRNYAENLSEGDQVFRAVELIGAYGS